MNNNKVEIKGVWWERNREEVSSSK